MLNCSQSARGRPLLLCVTLMVMLTSTRGALAQVAAEPASRVSIAISPFEMRGRTRRGEFLAAEMPTVFRIAFFPFEWMDVRDVSRSLPLIEGLASQQIAPRTSPSTVMELLEKDGIQLWMTGEIFPLGREIVVNATVWRVEDETEIYIGSATASEETVLQTVSQLAREVAGELERHLRPRSAPAPKVVLVGQFENEEPSGNDAGLESVLPRLLVGSLEAALSDIGIEYVAVKAVLGIERLGGGVDVDGVITGKFLITGDSVAVTGELFERQSELTSTIKVGGNVDDVFGIPQRLATRMSEIIFARLDEDGEWRSAVILRSDPQALYDRAETLARGGQDYLAILLYRAAMQRRPALAGAFAGLGRLYRRWGDYDASIEVLQQGLAESPNDPRLHLEAGIVHAQTGDYSAAIAELRSALRVGSRTTDVTFQVHMQLGDLHSGRGDYDTAIEHYEQGRTVRPDAPEVYGALASAYRTRGQPQRAVDILEAGIQRTGDRRYFANDLARAHNDLAHQSFNGSDYDNATAQFEKVLESNPSDSVLLAHAYVDLGRIAAYYRDESDYRAAIAYVAQATAVRPDYPAAHEVLGDLYHSTGQYALALRSFQGAFRLAPSPRLRGSLADAHRHLGRLDSAEGHLTIAIMEDPDNEWFHRLLGLVYWDRSIAAAAEGDADSALTFKQSAIRMLNDAIDIEPTDLSYRQLGEIYFRSEDYENAARSSEEALRLDPNDERTLRQLGMIYLAQGDYAKVIDHAERLADIAPTADAYTGLAASYRIMEEFDKAIAALQRALQVDSNHGPAYKSLADIYRDLEQYGRAVENYELAIRHNAPSGAHAALWDILDSLGLYEKAAATFERLVADDSTNVLAWSYLTYVSHDYLFDFQRAYEQAQQAADLDFGSVSSRANLAEAALTASQFAEAYQVANELLRDDRLPDRQQLDVGQKLSVKFVIIASLVYQGRVQQAERELGGFIRNYKYLEPGEGQWNYTGVRHFLQSSELEESWRELLMEIVNLLESEKSDERIAAFEEFLQSRG